MRYLVQDHPTESKRANLCIDKWMNEGETLWICQMTLCEVFWVLDRCYKLNKTELVHVFSTLLQTNQIQVEHEDVAWKALKDFERGSKLGFADCLIGRQNEHKECVHTYTFDKAAAKHLASTFKLLP